MGEYGTIPPQGGPGGDPKRPRSQRSHRSVRLMLTTIQISLFIICTIFFACTKNPFISFLKDIPTVYFSGDLEMNSNLCAGWHVFNLNVVLGSHFKLVIFWPDFVAILRDIARHGSNSYIWFTRKMLDFLILKFIFFPLNILRNLPIIIYKKQPI